MNRGFYLTLMMGPFTASPVPQPVIDALIEVQVNSALGSQGGFQHKFTLGKQSPLQRMLVSGFFDPRTRVITVVYFALLDAERLYVRAADDAATVG